MNKRLLKTLVIVALACAITLFVKLDLVDALTLEHLKSEQEAFQTYYAAHRSSTLVMYFIAYVLMAALSLPGAAVMTIAAGVLFGPWVGTLVVSFASSLGATFAFLIARLLFRDAVADRFGSRMTVLNEGVRKEGGFYLFTLRLVPVFPFFVVNLAMALTPIAISRFYFVSQLGMLPATFVYVNAGTQLGRIESLAGVVSPGLIGAFVLLGLFPLLAKRFIEWLRARKVYRRFTRPRRFDYNLVVIGAGSGGLVSSYIAAAIKAKVALVEKHAMGGDCLNTGCVPSKALIRSAKVLSYIGRAREFGLGRASVEFDFATVMQRVQNVIAKVAPHDSIERYTKLGVDCVEGEARLESPWEVAVGDRTLTTRSIVVATGGRPSVPPIEGIEDVGYVTSDTVWDLREQPRRLLVLGGGPIGCELAQCFQRLGSEVTQVQRGAHLLPREDPDCSKFVEEQFRDEGINLLLRHTAKRFVVDGSEKFVICDHTGGEVRIPFDLLLVALGRKANVSGFGLEQLGVALAPRGTVSVDGFLRTNFPNIYAVGDVAGPYQFTHFASHQAWYAALNSLLSPFKRFKADYRVIPWCTRSVDDRPSCPEQWTGQTGRTSGSIEGDLGSYHRMHLDAFRLKSGPGDRIAVNDHHHAGLHRQHIGSEGRRLCGRDVDQLHPEITKQ